MSVEVTITVSQPIRLDLEKMLGRDYFVAIRDQYDKAWPEILANSPSNNLVIFNSSCLGRGVDLNFLGPHTISLIMHTPGATADLKIFSFLLRKLTKKLKPTEIICEDEVFATEKICKIEQLAKMNLEAGMEFLLDNASANNPIEITAYKGPISIDEEEKSQFLNGQIEFDKYLKKKLEMPGVNELLVPMIVTTDIGTIWAVPYLRAGRYMILPKKPIPRNKNMKADYFVVFNNTGKAISYNNFLKEVDTSKRYDAERFIIKLTKKELDNIFKKYPEGLPRKIK